MKVQSIQLFLEGLARPLADSGAKRVAGDLVDLCRGLDAFAGDSICEFTEFLRVCDHYRRTGEVSAPARRTSAKRSSEPDAELIQDAISAIREIVGRIQQPDVDYQSLAGAVTKLDKKLKKPEMLAVVEQLGIRPAAKSKKGACEALHRHLEGLKEAVDRSRF